MRAARHRGLLVTEPSFYLCLLAEKQTGHALHLVGVNQYNSDSLSSHSKFERGWIRGTDQKGCRSPSGDVSSGTNVTLMASSRIVGS